MPHKSKIKLPKNHPLYVKWIGMKLSCYNKNHKSYKNYGKFGIKVCLSWKNNFKSFYQWAILNSWDENKIVIRINKSEDFTKSNCEIIDKKRSERNHEIKVNNNLSCKCGNIIFKGQNFCSKSCAATTHGQTGKSIYFIWNGMIQRCKNKNHRSYYRYGERGITVCNRWLRFDNFYQDMGDRPEGLQLDRINNDLGYYKENCRWVTHKENTKNKPLKFATKINSVIG